MQGTRHSIALGVKTVSEHWRAFDAAQQAKFPKGIRGASPSVCDVVEQRDIYMAGAT